MHLKKRLLAIIKRRDKNSRSSSDVTGHEPVSSRTLPQTTTRNVAKPDSFASIVVPEVRIGTRRHSEVSVLGPELSQAPQLTTASVESRLEKIRAERQERLSAIMNGSQETPRRSTDSSRSTYSDHDRKLSQYPSRPLPSIPMIPPDTQTRQPVTGAPGPSPNKDRRETIHQPPPPIEPSQAVYDAYDRMRDGRLQGAKINTDRPMIGRHTQRRKTRRLRSRRERLNRISEEGLNSEVIHVEHRLSETKIPEQTRSRSGGAQGLDAVLIERPTNIAETRFRTITIPMSFEKSSDEPRREQPVPATLEAICETRPVEKSTTEAIHSKATGINDLPLPILCQILRCLPFVDLWKVSRQVSRAWKSACEALTLSDTYIDSFCRKHLEAVQIMTGGHRLSGSIAAGMVQSPRFCAATYYAMEGWKVTLALKPTHDPKVGSAKLSLVNSGLNQLGFCMDRKLAIISRKHIDLKALRITLSMYKIYALLCGTPSQERPPALAR